MTTQSSPSRTPNRPLLAPSLTSPFLEDERCFVAVIAGTEKTVEYGF